MEEKGTPGWFVVLKKEARGRRIHSKETEHALGQEESTRDRQLFSEMEIEMRELREQYLGT